MTTLAAKDPGVDTEYGINFHDELVVEAAPRTSYALNQVLYFPMDTGYYYVVSTAGRTARNYPHALPRQSGETVTFGSCVLACKHPSEVTLTSISSAVWTLDDGITNASQRISGLVAYVTLSGGTDGADYNVTCRLTPSTGNPIDKTIIVPVRSL